MAPLGRDLAPVTPGAPRHFAWQAWHLVTSTFVSRGRRGTNSHLPSFCVAGVALMVLGGALGPGFGACDARGAAPLCVAGVALGDIHLPFTWQAWYKLTSTVVLRGRRGTYGTGWRGALLTYCGKTCAGPASESFVSSHLMIDSVWEDMNDDGHRFFCWLPDPLLTQCGKTGVATDKSKLFVTCVEFAPVREEVLQVLSGF